MKNLITIQDFKHIIRCSKAAYLNKYHTGLANNSMLFFNDSEDEMKETLCKQIQQNGIQIAKYSSLEERNKKTQEVLSTMKRFTVHNATLISKDNELVEVPCLQKGDKTIVWTLKYTPGEPSGADIWAAGYQYYVLQKCGVKPDRLYITFLNPEYIHGQTHPQQLFLHKNVADKCKHLQTKINKSILRLKKTFNYPKCPEVLIGYQCPEPKCVFHKHCWGELPKGNVFEFANMSFAQKFRLYQLEHERMIDVPANTRITATEKIQLDCHKKNKPHVGESQIRMFTTKFLSSSRTLFLDLNVAKTPLPKFPYSKPFANLPYHFNVVKETGVGIIEENFTLNSKGKYDIRAEFVTKLISALEPSSNCPIVVWNASYFKSYFNEYKKWCPGLSNDLIRVQQRLVSLNEPFTALHYYHVDLAGRTDFWAVLRVFVPGNPYPFLTIKNNLDAHKAFSQMRNSPLPELMRLRKELEQFSSFKAHALRTILTNLKNAH